MFPFKWELITAWSNLLVLLPELSKRRMIWVKVQFRKWSWYFSSAVIHFLFLPQDCKWQNCIDSQRYHWLPAHFDIIIFETFNDKKLRWNISKRRLGNFWLCFYEMFYRNFWLLDVSKNHFFFALLFFLTF